MDRIELQAKAKINLSLDVLRKRPDNYHEVRMIMQTIKLSDTVILEKVNEGIEVSCDSRWVPSGDTNIAYKAAKLVFDKYKTNSGVRISIIKRIPVAAGLAGGSSDAAAVLKGLNALFSLGATEEELMAIGRNVGADVPYCIKGGTALAEGIGEVLTDLKPLPGVNIVLVKPHIGVSTAWVYGNLDLSKPIDRPDTDAIINAVNNSWVDILAKSMKNVLETVTVSTHQIIQKIKDNLVEQGAAGSMMSGSGPTVFGIFLDRKSAEKAYTELVKCHKWDCFLTETE